MTEQQPTAVVGTYFTALGEGRVSEAMSLLAPDVQWHQPGANRFSGVHVGPEAVGALVGGMMEVSGGSFAIAPTGPLMGNGELVVAPVHFSGAREGISLDQDGVDLLTVRDGRIVEVRLFSADGPAEDLFWG